PGRPRVGEEQVAIGVEVEVVGAFEQLVAPSVDQRLKLLGLRVVGEDAAMTGGQVELAVLPAGALWLAGHPDLVRRIAVDYRDQLAVGLEIGDPPTADADKPQISLVIDGAAFEKLALRGIADIGKFLDRSDPRWQRR